MSTAESANRRLLVMATPIIVSNATVPLLGAVDTAVVGQIPDPSLIGGVALGAMVYGFVHASFNFLRMGTTGPTAQAVGAARAGEAGQGPDGLVVGGYGEVRNLLYRALLLAALIGVLVVLGSQLLISLSANLLHGSAAVEQAMRDYLGIRLWATPASLAMFAIIGWFYGLEDSRAPLVLQIAGNGLNIGLDFWFVLGLGWGVEGVAAATVIAEFAALGLGFFLVRRRLRKLPRGSGRTRVMDVARIKRMFAVNRDIFIRTISLIGGLAIYRDLSATLGDIVLAANAILFQLVSIGIYALDGFAHAAEALVGRAAGEHDVKALRKAAASAHLWGAAAALIMSLLILAFGAPAIDLFSVVPQVREVAREYLLYVVVLPIISVWAFTFDGIFLGAVQNKAMRNAMLVSLALYLGVLFLLFPRYGNHGLWLAVSFFFAIRGFTLWIAWPRILRKL